MNPTFILGAQDPEMQAIESLLIDAGMRFAYASVNGARVHAGNAYQADGPVVFVECAVAGIARPLVARQFSY